MGSALGQAGSVWDQRAGGYEVQGFLAGCRGPVAPPYLKSLSGLGVYSFKLKPQKTALFGPYRALQPLRAP